MTRNSRKYIKEVMKAELDAIVAVNKKDLRVESLRYFPPFILLYKLNQLTAITAKQCSIFIHLHCLLETLIQLFNFPGKRAQ